jgi:hypothetical protein
MNLISVNTDPKTSKGVAWGYWTGVLYLAPAKRSGFEVCFHRSPGCTATCLNTAGRGGILKPGERTNAIQRARVRRTKLYFGQRPVFLDQLHDDLERLRHQARKLRLKPAARLNGTSDLDWWDVIKQHPQITFYDYTKDYERAREQRYPIVFSRSETNEDQCWDLLDRGVNVSIVFRDRLPERFNGYPVVNGDLHDLIFLREGPCILGLKAKGRAKRDRTGFAVDTL